MISYYTVVLEVITDERRNTTTTHLNPIFSDKGKRGFRSGEEQTNKTLSGQEKSRDFFLQLPISATHTLTH